jgi:hypothetical protein
VITDRLLDGRWTWKSVARSVPFFVLAAGIAAITTTREQSIAKSWDSVDLSLRPFIAVSAIVHYVTKMLLPIHQAIIYPRWSESLWTPRYWISLVVVAAAAGLIWRYRRWLGDHWLWGLGLFLLTVAPVIGLKDFIWMQYAFVSDHYMYYGSTGVILMVGLLLEKWCRQPASFRRSRVATAGALSLVALAACGWRTVQQGATWKNNETLWTHTLTISPDCMIARLNLGNLRDRQGDLERALAEYKEMARIDPTFARAWLSCADVTRRLDRPEEAIQYYRTAVAAVEAKSPRSWSVHTQYADYLRSLGRNPEALAEYQAILRKRPPNAAAIQRAIQEIQEAVM